MSSARLKHARVSTAVRTFRTKREVVLAEMDRVRTAGVQRHRVLAKVAYGGSAAFRQALSERHLQWAVAIGGAPKALPAHMRLRTPRPQWTGGRSRRHPICSHISRRAESELATARWQAVGWRTRTRGPLHLSFATVRIRVADGPQAARAHHLPGNLAWLVDEWRANGEHKCQLTNHAANTSLRTPAATIKTRWFCVQAYQHQREHVGSDQIEGRSWFGLHHHAIYTVLAVTLLQHHLQSSLAVHSGKSSGR